MKRAAVLFSVGRYLYAMPAVWTNLDADGHVPPAFLAKLRAGLARQASTAA